MSEKKPLNINYDEVFDVVLSFSSEQNYEKLLDVILTKMMDITCSDAGTLYIVENDMLHFCIFKNKSLGLFEPPDGITKMKGRSGISLPPISLDKSNIQTVSAYAAINNEIVVVDDVYGSRRFNFQGTKDYDVLIGYKTRSMLVLPLMAHWEDYPRDRLEVLGVIQLMNTVDDKTGEPASYGDIYNPPIIPAISNIAAQTLANLMHMKETRMLLHSFVSTITNAIDARSAYTKDHTRNVVAYCSEFVEFLNVRFPPGHIYHFDKPRAEQLNLAAFLHDIGKLVTPLSIMDKADRLGSRITTLEYRFDIKELQLERDFQGGKHSKDEFDRQIAEVKNARSLIKSVNNSAPLSDHDYESVKRLSGLMFINRNGDLAPLLEPEDMESLSIRAGTLTPGERAVVQKHVTVTERLLGSVAFQKYYKNVPVYAKSHHEFLDGSGYPRGLRGDSLPIESCIITIVDIFEALVSENRPYKKGIAKSKALGILTEMAENGKLHKELVQLFREFAETEKNI